MHIGTHALYILELGVLAFALGKLLCFSEPGALICKMGLSVMCPSQG